MPRIEDINMLYIPKNMIIVRKGNYVWYIHENWVLALTFILSFLVGIIFKTVLKRRKNRQLNKTNENKNFVRGGDMLECVEETGIYEVEDPILMLTIRRVLKLGQTDGPIFVEPAVLCLSYIVSHTMKNIALHLYNIDIYRSSLSRLGVKVFSAAIMGLGLAAAFLEMIPVVAAGGLGTILFGLFLYLNANRINCNDFVYKLPQFRETEISYIDRPKISGQKIYVKSDRELPVYKLKEESKSIKNLEQFQPTLGSPETRKSKTEIEVKSGDSKKVYIPLHHRTKTLKDVRVHDDTETLEQVEPRVERFRKKRERIMENRVNGLHDEF